MNVSLLSFSSKPARKFSGTKVMPTPWGSKVSSSLMATLIISIASAGVSGTR